MKVQEVLSPEYIKQQISRFHGKRGHMTLIELNKKKDNVVFKVFKVSPLNRELVSEMSFTDYIVSVFVGDNVNIMVRSLLRAVASKVNLAGEGLAELINGTEGVEGYAIFRDTTGNTVLWSVGKNNVQVEQLDIDLLIDTLNSVDGVEIEKQMQAEGIEIPN